MRYAIFSDLHANRQAWAAVREDIARNNVDVLICLGDVVGYGPKPQEVLESVYEVTQNFVLGNHDAVIGGRLDADVFNDHAKEVIEWTRQHLNEEARQFFAEVPFTIEGADFLAVHAEAAQPGRFFYIVEAEDARASFEATTEQIIFVGHTHHPGRFELNGRQIQKFASEDFCLEKGKRYVVNTGSVGEPRTTDIHASYCIYDSFQKKITFRKLPFDIEAYKRDLLEVGLPIHPYFLDVYESGGGTVVHQPAELAMKRSPKIPAVAPHSRNSKRVVVRKEGEPHVARSFGSAAEAYRSTQCAQNESKGAALWVILSLAVALFVGAGIFALMKNGSDSESGGGGDSPKVALGGEGNGDASEGFEPGEPELIPKGIVWSPNLVVAGYKNLARDAKVTSDGFPAEPGSQGNEAAVDGDSETYLKKVDGKDSYLVALRFVAPTTVSALSMAGRSQHENAPEDFDVFADGKIIASVRGATYEENRLLVALPKVTATELELKISKSYVGAPAFREIGVYDWEVEGGELVVAAVNPGDGVGVDPTEEPETGGEPIKPVEAENGDGPKAIPPSLPVAGSAGQTFYVPVAPEGAALWHFTTEAPSPDWMAKPYTPDGSWDIGEAGFGQGSSRVSLTKTAWKTSDIWMRTRFEIPKGKLDLKRTWYLLLSHDDGCEVFLNGISIHRPESSRSGYGVATMADGVKRHLVEGINVLAVHCNQKAGEQFIDVGVVSIPPGVPIPGSARPVAGNGNSAVKWAANFLLAEYKNLAAGAQITKPDNHDVAGANDGVNKLSDGNPSTSWKGKVGRITYALELDFGKVVEMNAISIAPTETGVPKTVDFTIGREIFQAPNITYRSGRQLIRLGKLVKTRNVRLTVKAWDGDAPQIRELGVYLLHPKGKKPPGGGNPPSPAPAGTMVKLQKGSEGFERAADARIAVRMIPGTGQPSRNINMGGQPRLIVGTLGGQVNRSLMRFDFAEKIPEKVKMGDGKLTLHLVKGKQGEKVNLYLIHPKNGQWIEGMGKTASDQEKSGGGATWVSPNSAGRGGWFGGDGLGEPGLRSGYFSRKGASPVATGTVNEKTKVLEFVIPAEVMQLWADRPETNTGILLRIPNEDPEADRQVSAHSGESDELALRPSMELKFTK